jgi:hypothetical protein
MIKEKLKWSGKIIIENKNFLNSQNYLVNNNIKNHLLFDFYFVKTNNSLFISFIWKIIKKLIIFIINLYQTKHNNIFYYYLAHIVFWLALIPLLQINLYFYLFTLFFITFWFSNTVNDFYNSKVFILRIKNSTWNKYFRYSYISRLIEYIKFWEKVFDNNLKIILLSLFSSIFTTWFFYLFLWLI